MNIEKKWTMHFSEKSNMCFTRCAISEYEDLNTVHSNIWVLLTSGSAVSVPQNRAFDGEEDKPGDKYLRLVMVVRERFVYEKEQWPCLSGNNFPGIIVHFDYRSAMSV